MVVNRGFRNREILDIIVDLYVKQPMPVSSKMVAEIVGLSSATVRNVMYELEENGLVHQPHTSAGRIPTNEAYRLYAQSVMESFPSEREDFGWIKERYFTGDDTVSIEDVVSRALTTLSDLTKQACIALLPDLERGYFNHIKFVVLPDKRVLVVLVMMSQFVDTFTLRLDNINTALLERVANLLNSDYYGRSFYEIRRSLKERHDIEEGEIALAIGVACQIIEYGFVNSAKNKFFIEGVNKILSKPEILDADQLQYIFRVLENKREIASLISGDMRRGRFGIHIGLTLPERRIDELSILNAFFGVDDVNSIGAIGILGPTRMEYKEMVPLVEFFGKLINDHLRER